MPQKSYLHAIVPGYTLLWYRIDSVLGQGGFGITYLAQDVNLGQQVAIKEFLPAELACRDEGGAVRPISQEQYDAYQWGRQRFISEAQTLAKFHHPNIVQVHSVFEANNTAYMVMEWVNGLGLERALKSGLVGGEADLRRLLLALMEGVEQIHNAGFIHRDIKPSNIYLRSDGSPVLIDFGSARQAVGRQQKQLTALVSPGYAPFEQYGSTADQEDKQGPWTDIYALAATIYRAIAGRGPLDAMTRLKGVLNGSDLLVPASAVGEGKYSAPFLAAIDRALAFRAPDRPQTIKEWRAMLVGDGAQGDPPAPPGIDTSPRVTAGAPPEVDDATTAPYVQLEAADFQTVEDGPPTSASSPLPPPPLVKAIRPTQSVPRTEPEPVKPRPRPTPPRIQRESAAPPSRSAPEPAEPEIEPEPTIPQERPAPSRRHRELSRIGVVIGAAAMLLPLLLMLGLAMNVILGLCLMGGGAGAIVRACKRDFGIVKGGLAYLGGICAIFTFLGIGYSLLASGLSLLFAFGFLYASFAEDFLDL